MKTILASASPRRREILSNLGVDFRTVTADCDENCSYTEPHAFAKELAFRKAFAVSQKCSDFKNGETAVIGCDTVVFCGGEILGKPKDTKDAERMLRMLSGNTHKVVSGVAVLKGEKTLVSSAETLVTFDKLDEKETERYILTEEPYDKAGAYAIQGTASRWISGISGCYFNVVGLPVNLLCRMAKQIGISL